MPNKFLQANIQRQAVIKLIREFFEGRGFQEFEIPVLNRAMPLFPSVYPLTTKWKTNRGEQELFLPIFPERAMKKYLAAGAKKPYAIGHCFRGLEDHGRTHHPEFLMLEWYREDCDYRKIMEETRELIEFVVQRTGKQVQNITNVLQMHANVIQKHTWTVLSIEELWQERFGMSLKEVLTLEAVTALAGKLGYQTKNATWEQLFEQIYLNEIESKFPQEPFFLIDFPAQLSPLCRARADKPWLAERFEVYMQQLEIGNGNSEQVDAIEVRRYFEAENLARQAAGLPRQIIDEDFLASLEIMQKSGKKYAGMGLGVDRLAMVTAGIESMAEMWEF